MRDKVDEYISQVMLNKNKLLLLLGFLILMLTGLRLCTKREISKSGNHYEALGDMAARINEVWREGDYKFLLGKGVTCEEDFGDLFHEIKSNLYFRCNPTFLNCYLKNFEKIFPDSDIKFDSLPIPNKPGEKSFYQLISRVNFISNELPAFTVKAKALLRKKSKKSIDIFLEDSCNEAYLPKRVYAIGPFDENKIHLEWKWDNFEQEIFVDKNYISFRELKDWINYDLFFPDKILEDLIPNEKIELSAPATGLSIEQMSRYCNFRGKELLHSRVFDAASFHPVNLQARKREVVFRGPFPWSYERKDSEIYKFWENEDSEFDKRTCSKIITKECIKDNTRAFPLESAPTWIGIFNSLGGYGEVVINKLTPEDNVHPSSITFNLRNKLHQIGVRAKWNQKQRDSTSFSIPSFKGQFDELKLAFRCMRVL